MSATFDTGGLGAQIYNLGRDLSARLSSVGQWLVNPIGEGKNATNALQLGLAGYGLFNKQRQFEDQLEEARRQYAFSQGNTRANFTTQGTNFLNQGLFQLEALNAFNPNASAERAQNLNAAVNQLTQAGNHIGLGNDTFAEQQNAIAKYNQLRN